MKFFLTLMGVAVCATVFAGAKINIELDGRYKKAIFSEMDAKSSALKFVPQTSKDGSTHYYSVRGTEDLTSEWKTYSFSFVCSVNSFAFGLSATTPKNQSVDYDDLKIEGGKVYNTSFEIINEDKEADGWRYYNPETICTGDDAADGKHYVRVSHSYANRCNFLLTPGEKVTVTFKARIGKELKATEGKWTSSGRRKVK